MAASCRVKCFAIGYVSRLSMDYKPGAQRIELLKRPQFLYRSATKEFFKVNNFLFTARKSALISALATTFVGGQMPQD